MTDKPDEPEAEFIDLSAVDLFVETTLYPQDCDELDTFALTAGADPFVLLRMSQKPGENTLVYEFVGSVIDNEFDLLQTLEVFTGALREKIENAIAQGNSVEGEVVEDE
jgi:hypothetical protein